LITEVKRVINGTSELRYQASILTSYSMGLRLGGFDSERMKVYIRLGKGQKDRFVTLPNARLLALRKY